MCIKLIEVFICLVFCQEAVEVLRTGPGDSDFSSDPALVRQAQELVLPVDDERIQTLSQEFADSHVADWASDRQ